MTTRPTDQRYIDTQKLFCMRCGAWDAKQCRPDERMCGLNCALLTSGKICGFNCKLQRLTDQFRAKYPDRSHKSVLNKMDQLRRHKIIREKQRKSY
jgi:hypothetical protein